MPVNIEVYDSVSSAIQKCGLHPDLLNALLKTARRIDQTLDQTLFLENWYLIALAGINLSQEKASWIMEIFDKKSKSIMLPPGDPFWPSTKHFLILIRGFFTKYRRDLGKALDDRDEPNFIHVFNSIVMSPEIGQIFKLNLENLKLKVYHEDDVHPWEEK